jgi:ABC-2 type transport system permease protein
MRAMLTLIRREFTAFFLSPIAYVVLFLFLILTGLLFHQTLSLLTEEGPRGAEWPLQVMFGNNWFWMAFAVIPPLLTMRQFAEERGTGTLEMLLTAPLRDWQVVLAKYLASLGFYIVLWLPTLLYIPIWMNLKGGEAKIDPWPVWTTYLGMFAVGAMFLAIGLFVSSLVKSQLVAAIIAIAVTLVFVVVTFVYSDVGSATLTSQVLSFFSVPMHFNQDFTRGVIDTRHLVLYGTVALFCLFMTVRSLESRRWR